jgi:hypothetical protein
MGEDQHALATRTRLCLMFIYISSMLKPQSLVCIHLALILMIASIVVLVMIFRRSLEELGGGVTVDLNHKVSKAASTVHHTFTGDLVHFSDVLLGEGGVVLVVGVDIGAGKLETLLGPLVEVTVEEQF